MLPILWNARARQDVHSIVRYIGKHNPIAAQRMANIISDSTQFLAAYPLLYRSSDRVPGCREIIVHRNYVVVYRVEKDCIRVVRVLHASRIYF